MTRDFILLFTLLLLRFQSYPPDGSVCDVRCLLGGDADDADDADDDLQEVT